MTFFYFRKTDGPAVDKPKVPILKTQQAADPHATDKEKDAVPGFKAAFIPRNVKV